MTKHWHVATGLAGYGPDASDSDGFAYAFTPTELASVIRGELDIIADSEHGNAESCADSGEYELAWNTMKNADAMSTLAMSLDNKRSTSPLYADDAPLWDATILRLVEENFPFDFREGNSRLYVWECETPDECESVEEENECRHTWVAGMMYVDDEDVEAIAAIRPVACETCGRSYADRAPLNS